MGQTIFRHYINADIYGCNVISQQANDILAFESIDQDLNEMEYVFEGKALSNINYVISVMKRGPKTKLELGRVNMSPIIQAFKSKKGK